MEDIFLAIGIMLIVATILSYLARMINQPMIPAYVVAGVILGPLLGIITNSGIIGTLSEIGIAFLLFIAGLELDLRKLREVGAVASIGGLAQIISLFSAAFLLSLIFGFGKIESVYLGLIVALSSTMVIVKILSDKRSIDTLHGRIIIGILIVQDIVAIISLSILRSVDSFSGFFMLISAVKAVILIGLVVVFTRLIIPHIFRRAAKNQEILFLMAITFLFAISLLFQHIGSIIVSILQNIDVSLSGEIINVLSPGFSIAIGAFAAGVGLAGLPFNFQIIGQVKPLRDFFSTIFFVSLGLGVSISSVREVILPFVALLVLVVALKPLIVFILVSFFGYLHRPSFIAGISLGQISEFSLILVSQGFLLGHVSQGIVTITILLAVFSIIITSYLMEYETPIYLWMSSYISGLDKVTATSANLGNVPKGRYDVIVCGYNRIGFSIGNTLKRLKKKMLVIDYNPDVIRKLKEEKVPCIFGDIGNNEIMERVDLKHARIVISTVPTLNDNEMIIEKAKKENPKISIILTANQIDEALTLYEKGADYVILPHFLGGKHISMMIEDYHRDLKSILKLKVAHIDELKERKRLGHEHPRHE
ncbi:cation:proton antiporter [Candidatus Woesearchaeota archaeon]|nr:cation:proton antiporter [Candidatus Woesearchaeota archaeon]